MSGTAVCVEPNAALAHPMTAVAILSTSYWSLALAVAALSLCLSYDPDHAHWLTQLMLGVCLLEVLKEIVLQVLDRIVRISDINRASSTMLLQLASLEEKLMQLLHTEARSMPSR